MYSPDRPPMFRKEERADFDREEWARIERAVPNNEAMKQRLERVGIDDVAVFRQVLLEIDGIPETDIFTHPDHVPHAVKHAWLEGLEERYHATQLAPGALHLQTVPGLRKLLATLAVTKDLWANGAPSQRFVRTVVEHFLKYIRSDRGISRILGLEFDAFSKQLSDHGAALQQKLLDTYPIGILPSLALRDCSTEAQHTFALHDAVPYHSIHLLSVPLDFEFRRTGKTEFMEYSACEIAEEAFRQASTQSAYYLQVNIGKTMIGIQKRRPNEEWTFLALRSVMHGERPVLLKGGIYQFHGTRFDMEASAVDLARHGTVGMIPLRQFIADDTNTLDAIARNITHP